MIKNYLDQMIILYLKANFNKAKRILNWKPKISFKSLVNEMVDYDLNN